jgi:predicted ATPase
MPPHVAQDEDDDLVGRTLCGRYRVKAKLGAGGMGAVYVAVQERLEREVALKVLKGALEKDGQARARFVREARTLAQLQHANVVSIFDHDVDDAGRAFLVMELLQGSSLRKHIATHGPLSAERSIPIMRQIVEGLQAAHALGIVHRDLKPDNVVLLSTTADTVKLLDFGVARLIGDRKGDATVTGTGVVVGTPGYLAPEAALQGVVDDPRSDFYALGVLWFEALVGAPPFTAATPLALIMRHATERAPRLGDVKPGLVVAPDVEALVMRLLSKRAEERPANAQELLNAIAALSTTRTASTPHAITAAPRARLPAQLTRLIGRERHLDELRETIRAHRLLTLTGAGGSGKSRLALQLASDVERDHRDGALFVELAPLADAVDVPRALASAFGIKEDPTRPILDTVVDVVRSWDVVVVFDNCEHVIAAAARVAEALLHAAPRLRVIATSREALGVAGEVAWRVPSLATPTDVNASLDVLSDNAAVQLFVERAQSAQPSFMLDKDNAAAVAHICERLDGIPLAIELAAARVTSLSVAQIQSRLDDRFRLLTGGSRTALPRQQTLRALVDWSYSLLNDAERALLLRLSVFAGGCSLESAEAVCGDVVDGKPTATVAGNDILDLLASLVNKSVLLSSERGGEIRYRFLETIRDYARNKLLESDEGARTRDRHLTHFIALAASLNAKLFGPEQAWSIGRCVVEHENFHAALSWSLGDPPRAAQLMTLLSWTWQTAGHLEEARRWFDQIAPKLVVRDDIGTALQRARLLHAGGSLNWVSGDYARARALLEEGAALLRAHPGADDRELSVLLAILSAVILCLDDVEHARATAEEGVAIGERIGDPFCVARGLGSLVDTYRMADDHEGAARVGDDGIAAFRKLGMAEGIGFLCQRRACTALNQNDVDGAARLLAEAIDAFARVRNGQGIALCALVAAGIEAARDHHKAGAMYLGALARGFEREKHQIQSVDAKDRDRIAARLRGALGDDGYRAAVNDGRTWSVEQTIERVRAV